MRGDRPEPARRFQAAHAARHDEIHHRHIRRLAFEQCQRFLCAGRLPGDAETRNGFEKRAQSAAHYAVIVHQEDDDGFHRTGDFNMDARNLRIAAGKAGIGR